MNEQLMNTLQNMDAMDLLKKLSDHTADLTILDPDYQDWDKLCEEGLIQEAIRVTKPTGNIICFTKQPFDFNLRNAVNDVFRREIIWSFSNGGAWVSNRMPLVSFQKIYWLTPTDDFYIDVRTGLDYNEGTKSTKRSSKVFGGYKSDGKQFNKSDDGTWLRDHYHYNKPSMGEIPAKPRNLMAIFIRCFCPENGIVLDPFFGSGMTGYVCRAINRNFIASEKDKGRADDFNKKYLSELLLF